MPCDHRQKQRNAAGREGSDQAMKVEHSPELLAYMQEKRRKTISVEVAKSDHSDFEVAEIYLRLVKDDFASYLKDKKRYRSVKTEEGELLLPPYVLEIDPVVRLCLKRRWVFRTITVDGIRL